MKDSSEWAERATNPMETSENESGSSPAREKMPQEKHVPKDNKTADESTQKDPMIKKLWARTGLTLPMILMMIKYVPSQTSQIIR